MTNQEAYEAIRAYFTRPRARLAKDADGGCFYRWGGRRTARTKCAVGCLIPNDQYDPDFEGCSAYLLVPKVPVLADINRDFLERVQNAHDVSDDVAEFLTRLDKVARSYGVETARS